MPKPVSPVPDSFANSKEREYWHMAQDTAYRAGAALVEIDGATWLQFESERRFIVTPEFPDRIWFETWRLLHEQYSDISRLWIGGRPLPP